MSNQKFWWLVAAAFGLPLVGVLMLFCGLNESWGFNSAVSALGAYASVVTVCSLFVVLFQWKEQKKKDFEAQKKEEYLRSENLRLTEISLLRSAYLVNKDLFDEARSSTHDAKNFLSLSHYGEEGARPEYDEVFAIFSQNEKLTNEKGHANQRNLIRRFLEMLKSRDIYMKKMAEYKYRDGLVDSDAYMGEMVQVELTTDPASPTLTQPDLVKKIEKSC